MSKKKDREAGAENLESADNPEQVEAPLADPPKAASPVAPVPVEPTPEPVVAPAPAPVEPSDLMTLRVYATIAGPKWDQMAGFVNFAMRNKLGPFTMQQWREQFERFKNRTVG